MSKERELLQRAKILLDCVCTSPVQKEIEELLAQPEQYNEPVAWMYDWKTPTGEVQHVFRSKNHLTTDLRCVSNEVENVRPLYLEPPTRDPLTEDAICEILLKKEWKGFVELVRQIEKQHNIGE